MQKISRPEWRTKIIPLIPPQPVSPPPPPVEPRVSYPPSLNTRPGSSASSRRSSNSGNSTNIQIPQRVEINSVKSPSISNFSRLSSLQERDLRLSRGHSSIQFRQYDMPFGFANIQELYMNDLNDIADRVNTFIF